MDFADIHIHALWGCDDGPSAEEEMLRLVEASYADGVRVLCLTPHFHLGYYGDNRSASETAFLQLEGYCRERFPDLRLYLANELRYSQGAVAWLDEGMCRSMEGDRCVLVDFSASESEKTICRGLYELLNAGYRPVLAHAERYRRLHGRLDFFAELRAKGVLIQLDAQSLLGGFGVAVWFQAWRLVKGKLADLIGSDAHDLQRRPPGIQRAYRLLCRRVGTEYANSLCSTRGQELLEHKSEGKDMEMSNG